MGRRPGPPPTPTALKLVRGNPGKGPINHREPKPRIGTPTRPGWLGPEERKVWRKTVAALRELHVLSIVDGDAVAVYCQTFVRWKAAEEYLNRNGLTYEVLDENGNVRYIGQRPEVAIARHTLTALRSYQQEFGLTPAARSRIQTGAPAAPGADEIPEGFADDMAGA